MCQTLLSVLCNGYQSDTVTIIANGGTGIGTYQYYIPGVFPIPQYNNIFSGLYLDLIMFLLKTAQWVYRFCELSQ